MADAERRRRDLEAELQDREAQREKFQSQTALVKTNEEYSALLREIDQTSERIGQIEEEILETMDRTEQLQVEVAATVERETAGLRQLQKELDERRARLEQVETELVERGARTGDAARPGRPQGAQPLQPRVRPARQRGRPHPGSLLQCLPPGRAARGDQSRAGR